MWWPSKHNSERGSPTDAVNKYGQPRGDDGRSENAHIEYSDEDEFCAFGTINVVCRSWEMLAVK